VLNTSVTYLTVLHQRLDRHFDLGEVRTLCLNLNVDYEDVNVTRQIVKAGKLLDIDVMDHLVLASRGHVSLKERSLGFD
jgi:hypothetical protein